MSSTTHQTSLEETDGRDNAILELQDKNETTLREGDVLANTRTNEKLVILGYNEEVGSVEYYSNYERGEGLHDPTHLASCFDAIFRTTDENTQLIPLPLP